MRSTTNVRNAVPSPRKAGVSRLRRRKRTPIRRCCSFSLSTFLLSTLYSTYKAAWFQSLADEGRPVRRDYGQRFISAASCSRSSLDRPRRRSGLGCNYSGTGTSVVDTACRPDYHTSLRTTPPPEGQATRAQGVGSKCQPRGQARADARHVSLACSRDESTDSRDADSSYPAQYRWLRQRQEWVGRHGLLRDSSRSRLTDTAISYSNAAECHSRSLRRPRNVVGIDRRRRCRKRFAANNRRWHRASITDCSRHRQPAPTEGCEEIHRLREAG